jgi:DNA polymerase-3 subunit epsilon
MMAADGRLHARRLVVLDTETTGLNAAAGDRIVEIGAVELINCVPSGREFHHYLNPGRAMDAGAERVHGLSDAFLADKPGFAEIAGDLLDFLGEDALVIHNAAFDIGFLDAELARCGFPPLTMARAICTVELARQRLPGARHSLDALCERFGIDRSARVRHGALLDASLLARVYLELVGGAQIGMALAGPADPPAAPDPASAPAAATGAYAGRSVAARQPSAAELERHAAFIARLSDPLWPAGGSGGTG